MQQRQRPHWTRGLAASAALALLLGLLYELDRHYYVHWSSRNTSDVAERILFAIVVPLPLLTSLLPRARLPILLAASVAATVVVLHLWALVLFAYVALAVGLARVPGRILPRAAILIVAWVVLPVLRVRSFSVDHQAATIFLAVLWTNLLYAALFLMVERARDPIEMRSSLIADLFYFLALPRVLVPFFQPISPNRLTASARPHLPWPLLGRGVALGLYGAATGWVTWNLLHAIHAGRHPYLGILGHFVGFYAHASYLIFLAVAVFRLLGFNLPSGFGRPFLSHTFAEFFRKFNYYIRDAVLSVFYYPLLGHLRQHMSPRKAAVISSYTAILVGSFLLNDLLVPMTTTIAPHDQFQYYLDPIRLISFVAFWTLIVLPNAGIAPRRREPRTRLRAALSIIAFNATYFVIWYAQYWGRKAHWLVWQ